MVTPSISPFSDQVEFIGRRLNRSFHALPISGGASLRDSEFEDHYYRILGNGFTSELSVAQPFLDNLILPQAELACAENLAARVFGADATVFATCGTTISNGIALAALCPKPGVRVLADRNLHQSLHFNLSSLDARVDYLPCHTLDDELGLCASHPGDLKQLLRTAENAGDPYQLLVLNGQSYEGVIHSIPKFLQQIVESGTSLQKVLVDEAWGAANSFNPDLAPHTAMAAAQDEAVRAAGICVVATQSAHKSLSALRQASMIHIGGDMKIANAIRDNRYRLHTTSPSSRILLSLDLARAQAQTEGKQMMQRAIELAQTFNSNMRDMPLRQGFTAFDLSEICAQHDHLIADPTKIILRSSLPTLGGKELRKTLFEEFGYYVSLTFSDAVLFNFHFGIRGDDVSGLTNALNQLAQRTDHMAPNRISKDYIISYPPGIPLVVPGEEILPNTLVRMRQEQQNGARILTI